MSLPNRVRSGQPPDYHIQVDANCPSFVLTLLEFDEVIHTLDITDFFPTNDFPS